MTSGRSWPAPAKLNLFLHILGRRPDGYHELQTVFQFLDFGDDVFVEPRADGAIQRAAAVEGVAEAEDLTLKAAHALRQRTGCKLGCDIRVEKRIPVGGGLGGGSSNAATALVALNNVWKLGLSIDDLAAVGLTLGADVPVFVRGDAAWAEGVGEKLTPVAPPERWYLLVTPRVAVISREMYEHPALPRATPRIAWADFLGGRVHNDFVPVVRQRYQEVAKALDWAAGLGKARMSGTGSTVFLDFGTRPEAESARAKVPGGWRATVARGLNRSPLRAA